MCEEPSSLLGQVHDLVESRDKELDEVDGEEQPVQSCAVNLSCRVSFREWGSKAKLLLCRAVDVTDFLKAHANLARDRQALELEKEQMQHVSVADNDVLTLNVGGTILCTHRSTLTQAEGSALAARFSGRWEQSLSRDDQGRIFLDFDPYSFQQILLCLRMRAIADSIDSKWCPRIDSDKQEPFDSLVKYLQLEEYMGLKAAMKAAVADFPTLVSASKGVLVSQDQNRATFLPEGNRFYESVASSQLQAPVCYLKCKVHVLDEWMFFGIGKSPDMAHTLPWSQINTYGWSTHSSIVNGEAQQSHGEGWQAGDWVLLKLDLPNNMLSISHGNASTAGTMFMPIPDFADAPGHPVFLIILSSRGDHIQVLPVTSEDRLLL